MQILSMISVAKALAKALSKPVLFLSLPDEDYDEIEKAAPYLHEPHEEYHQVFCDGCALIVCEDMEECNRLYNQTVGDDGPTETNKYEGPARIYALTIDADGQARNENT